MSTAQEQLKAIIEQAAELLDQIPDAPAESNKKAARRVTSKLASEITGYSMKTLEGRRADGSHPRGEIWWHDEKGALVYDIEALEAKMSETRWQSKSMLGSSAVATRSESGSDTKVRKSTKSTQPHVRLRA